MAARLKGWSAESTWLMVEPGHGPEKWVPVFRKIMLEQGAEIVISAAGRDLGLPAKLLDWPA
jgi:hypothetical protein